MTESPRSSRPDDRVEVGGERAQVVATEREESVDRGRADAVVAVLEAADGQAVARDRPPGGDLASGLAADAAERPPRYLNDPVFWRHSAFTKIRRPANRSSSGAFRSGVRTA